MWVELAADGSRGGDDVDEGGAGEPPSGSGSSAGSDLAGLFPF